MISVERLQFMETYILNLRGKYYSFIVNLPKIEIEIGFLRKLILKATPILHKRSDIVIAQKVNQEIVSKLKSARCRR